MEEIDLIEDDRDVAVNVVVPAVVPMVTALLRNIVNSLFKACKNMELWRLF